MKGAFLVHGWATDNHVWHKYWMLDREAPMVDMLEEKGYHVTMIELPGTYLERDKDLDWYARYLGHVIREREDLDEIVLIGHSMGGIVARKYLTIPDDIFSEGHLRTSKLISLGSPNHGTSVPHFDLISSFLTTIADMVLPWEDDLTAGEEHNYFMTTPCYRDIQLGSRFLEDLNQKDLPSHIDHHVIWTNGDTVADPQHTCVLPGARNHLLDRIAVNHFNMCYRPETVEMVGSILEDELEVNGLQEHPPKEGCPDVNGHHWLPDTSLVNREGINLWKCTSCKTMDLSHALPAQITCKKVKGLPVLHKWARVKRVYRYKFRCTRCQKTIWFPEGSNLLESL
jgi:pimeloyl-ACP methyl ester carboxylesterase